jgi:hypothetical protein
MSSDRARRRSFLCAPDKAPLEDGEKTSSRAVRSCAADRRTDSTTHSRPRPQASHLPGSPAVAICHSPPS